MPDVFPLTASLPEGKKQQQKTGTELTVGALKKKKRYNTKTSVHSFEKDDFLENSRPVLFCPIKN